MKWQKRNKGSITLEAAMMVPMFIILMLLVNGLFIFFMGQQIMLHAMVQSAKSLAFDPYSSQRIEGNTNDDLADMFVDIAAIGHGNYVSNEKWYEENLDDLDSIVEERFVAYLQSSRTKAVDLLEEIGVKNGLSGLDFSGCSLSDEGVLTMKLTYEQEFIFNAADLASFERTMVVKVKVFEHKEL